MYRAHPQDGIPVCSTGHEVPAVLPDQHCGNDLYTSCSSTNAYQTLMNMPKASTSSSTAFYAHWSTQAAYIMSNAHTCMEAMPLSHVNPTDRHVPMQSKHESGRSQQDIPCTAACSVMLITRQQDAVRAQRVPIAQGLWHQNNPCSAQLSCAPWTDWQEGLRPMRAYSALKTIGSIH